jgi:hypothetical protein
MPCALSTADPNSTPGFQRKDRSRTPRCRRTEHETLPRSLPSRDSPSRLIVSTRYPRFAMTGRGFAPSDSAAWLVSSTRSRFTALRIGDDAVPSVALRMIDLVSRVASVQCRTGQLEGADRTAGRLMGLARWLVRSHGDQSDSHMLLSEAYFQMSKNARERKDYPAIEQALSQALESAREAVRLDPGRQDARHFVDRLLPRLAFFEDICLSGPSPAAQVGIR